MEGKNYVILKEVICLYYFIISFHILQCAIGSKSAIITYCYLLIGDSDRRYRFYEENLILNSNEILGQFKNNCLEMKFSIPYHEIFRKKAFS